MPKHISILLRLILPLALLMGATQGRNKPSDHLRQLDEQQRKLRAEFDREVEARRAQPEDWEARLETLRQAAAQRAATLKIADWQGEELYTLAALHRFAEQFAPAAEAYRAYIADPKSSNPVMSWRRNDSVGNARLALAQVLLELERVDEAAQLAEEKYDWIIEMPLFEPLIALHQALATAYHERGRHAQVVEQAKQARTLIDLGRSHPRVRRVLGEETDRHQVMSAALEVAALERLGKAKEAAALHQATLKAEAVGQTDWRNVYETELTAARLIGMATPDLAAPRWLDGPPTKLGELRGKVVLLDFWAMWCGPCITAFPRLREWQTKFGERGLQIIGVTRFYGRSDTAEDLSREQEWQSLQEFKRRHQLPYPVAVGKQDDVADDERFGVRSLPTVILIDRRGNVRFIRRGTGNQRKLEQQVTKLIRE